MYVCMYACRYSGPKGKAICQCAAQAQGLNLTDLFSSTPFGRRTRIIRAVWSAKENKWLIGEVVPFSQLAVGDVVWWEPDGITLTPRVIHHVGPATHLSDFGCVDCLTVRTKDDFRCENFLCCGSGCCC